MAGRADFMFAPTVSAMPFVRRANCGRWRWPPPSAPPCRTCPPWPRPACPATPSTPGSACWRRQARPRRSSMRSMRRSPRPWWRRTCASGSRPRAPRPGLDPAGLRRHPAQRSRPAGAGGTAGRHPRRAVRHGQAQEGLAAGGKRPRAWRRPGAGRMADPPTRAAAAPHPHPAAMPERKRLTLKDRPPRSTSITRRFRA